MSQQEINPLEDWASEELSEAELDALAGGRSYTLSLATIDPNPFVGDVNVVVAKTDSAYTSYYGAKGTTNSFTGGTPMNLTLFFP